VSKVNNKILRITGEPGSSGHSSFPLLLRTYLRGAVEMPLPQEHHRVHLVQGEQREGVSNKTARTLTVRPLLEWSTPSSGH
jgi:hypothetical protein